MPIILLEMSPEIEVRGDLFIFNGLSGGEEIQFAMPSRAMAVFQHRTQEAFRAEMARRTAASTVVALEERQRFIPSAFTKAQREQEATPN